MTAKSSRRSPEEDKARGRCREIARAEGSSLRRTEDKKYIMVGECERWPEGLLLLFQGWTDARQRLEELTKTPLRRTA